MLVQIEEQKDSLSSTLHQRSEKVYDYRQTMVDRLDNGHHLDQEDDPFQIDELVVIVVKQSN